MLVKFESEVGNLTMFGDVALRLLKLMGHSGTVPSALLAEDIPPALARLREGLERAGPERPAATGDDDAREPPVSLKRRAHPLIELLERAAREEVQVTWR